MTSLFAISGIRLCGFIHRGKGSRYWLPFVQPSGAGPRGSRGVVCSLDSLNVLLNDPLVVPWRGLFPRANLVFETFLESSGADCSLGAIRSSDGQTFERISYRFHCLGLRMSRLRS
jgi:hypothetical protein